MLPQSSVNFPIRCHNITGIVLNQLQTKGVKARVAPLTITLNDPHGDFVPPITTVLGFAGFEVLVTKEGTLLSGDTSCVPLNCK